MKLWNSLSAALLVGLVVAIVLNFDDYGTTWDEIFHYGYGDDKLAYYQELFSADDPWAVIQEARADNYPGFYDINLALINKLSPLSVQSTSHLLCALFGLLGIVAVWAIGYRIGGPRTAFICALFLAFMPRYFGHMWFNVKDIPFAATYTWSLYCLIRFTECLPRISWRWLIPAGIITGFAMGVRSAGMLLGGYLFIVLAGDWLRTNNSGVDNRQLLRLAARYIGVLVVCGIVALISVLPWWPYLHANPIVRLFEITAGLQTFFWDGIVLYNGEYLRASALPRTYLSVWFGITTPVVILLLLGLGCIGLIKVCWGQIKARLQGVDHRKLIIGLMILGFAFPMVYVLATRPRIYDGLRQFLFILPSAAVLAALSLEWLLSHIKKEQVRKLILTGSLVITAGSSLFSYISLHPYEYIYFNELIGGLPGAYQRFETEYYGLSYREMTEKLVAGDHRVPWDRPTRVSNNGAQWHIEPYFTPDYKYVLYTEPSDYFLTYTRKNVTTPPGDIIDYVEREGVPLNFIVQRWSPGPDPLGDPSYKGATPTDNPPE